MLPDKEFEDLIRKKMAELDEAPPTDGWKKISAEIKPSKKPRPIWWWLGPLLLLLTGAGVYYFTTNNPAVQPARTAINSKTKSSAPSVNISKPKTETDDRNITQRKNKANPNNSSELNQQPALTLKTDKRLNAPFSGKSSRAGANQPGKYYPARTAGVGGNRPTAPEKINRSFSVASPDLVAPQPDQPPQAQSGIATTDKPTASTPADSAGNRANPLRLDSLQVAAKKDSVGPENLALAQEPKTAEKDKKNKPKVWEAGFTFASRYAFRKFTPNATDNIFITNVNTRNQSHPERLGYELGFNLARSLTQNLYVETGIAWLQLKENLSYIYTTGTIDTILVTASPGQTHINTVYKMDERQLASSYAYGGWRLGATCYFWDNGRRRFNFSLAGGINLLIKGETEERRNGTYVRTVVFPSKANMLEQANYNLLVGAGYNARFGQKFDLMLMPSLNYFMGSTFKEREPLGLRPYSLGLNVAIKRRFSRQN